MHQLCPFLQASLCTLLEKKHTNEGAWSLCIFFKNHDTQTETGKFSSFSKMIGCKAIKVLAALVFAVGHFKVCLLGNKVTVYIDHQSLVSAFVTRLKNQIRGLLARWYVPEVVKDFTTA